MRGSWRHCTDERGIASVMAIFIMVMMLVAGIFLVRMSSTEGDIAYGGLSAEGSFFAADAGINVGIDRVDKLPPVVAVGGAWGEKAAPGAFMYLVCTPPGSFSRC